MVLQAFRAPAATTAPPRLVKKSQAQQSTE
jgi:hypothetical protein